MKTNCLIACIAAPLLMFSQTAPAAGNSPATGISHTASIGSGHRRGQTHRSAALSNPAVSGVIPRAIGNGNPLQMLNPLAPSTYGTAEENVSMDPDVPGKANGINLFSVSF
jgi:hypothetical protein